MNREIETIKNKIVNKILTFSAIFVIPIYIIAILRWLETEWLNIYYFHTVLVALVIILFLTRKRTNFSFKTHSISIIYLITGVIGFYKLGFAGAYYLCFIPVVLCGILVGRKSAFIYLIIVVLFYAFISAGFYLNFIKPEIDITAYNRNFVSLLLFNGAISYVSVILIIAATELYSFLIRTIKTKAKTEKELTESEEKFHKAFTVSPYSMSILTLEEGKFIEVNKGFENNTGYKREEIIGKTAKEINLWKDFETNRSKIRVILNKEGSLNDYEIEFINKSGEEIIYLLNARIINLKDRPHILAIGNNISLRKKIEKELKESEEKYKGLFEKMMDAFALHKVVFDKEEKPIDYIFIEVNKAFEDHTGLSRDKLLNKKVTDVLPGIEKDKADWIGNYGKVAATGEELRYEQFSETLNKWYSVLAFSPKKGYFATIFKDITGIKNHEIKLKQSEERFRKLSDLSFEGIVLHKKGTAVDLNNSFVNLTGYKYDELIGKNLIEFLIPEKYKTIVYNNIEREYILPYEIEFIRKDGNLLPVELESTEIVYYNEKVRVTAVRDISERKEYEKQVLNATIKAEEKERDRFSRDLHDGLGPTLSTIKMYFEWLQEDLDDSKKEMLTKEGYQITEESISMVREISNNISPRTLNSYGLTAAIRTFVKRLRNESLPKIDLSSNIEGLMNPNIEITLYRITTELINNTLKHARAYRITINLKEETGKVYFEYTDNGIGFEADKIENFTGLGLFNIRNRIKTLGGEINIVSSPKKGMELKIQINK